MVVVLSQKIWLKSNGVDLDLASEEMFSFEAELCADRASGEHLVQNF